MSGKWKIGAVIASMGLTPREGVLKAREIGLDGFQIYVTKGEMYPDNLSPGQRRDFKRLAADQGLEIAALCADFDWVRGFTDAEFNKMNVPRIKKCIDLACDLDTRVVTMHIGHLPADKSDAVYQEALRVTTELAQYAEARGKVLCSETGPEAPDRLLDFLEEVPSKGVGVNYDPANLVMCGPFDAIGGVAVLKDYIHHTHAKDGVCLGAGKYEDLPLGQGGVVFPYYLAALDAAGYTGYLTIEREAGDDTVADVARAVKFLDELQQGELPVLG